MKKHLPILAVFVCLVLLIQACNVSFGNSGGQVVKGSGDVTTEDRPVSGVKRVVLSNQGDLTIQVGAAEKLVVEAQPNLLPYIETDVKGGTLEIRTQNNVNLQNTKPIRYTLTVTGLEGLTITSSGNIIAPDLQASRFSVSITSSGNLQLASLSADKLEVEVTSSGDVTIKSGQVPQVDLLISSSGDIAIQDVTAQKVSAMLSSSGDARVWATDTLDGTLTSSGNLYYRGNPQVNVKTTSSGKVTKTGD